MNYLEMILQFKSPVFAIKGSMREKIYSPLATLAKSLGLVIIISALISPLAFATPGTTTLGTRNTVSQPNTPITSNADAQWGTYSRDPEYPMTVTLPLEFIDTSEGGTIAVLVSVPADENGSIIPGQFPAVLTQTAYRIDLSNFMGQIIPSQTTLIIGGQDKFLIQRGYISVAVDVRGTGMSSGETGLLGAEEQAAYADVVDWITQQPWFDGNLGLAGTSYLGITTLLTAAQQHPAVKAVFAEVPMGDPYRGTVVPGGMLNATFINLWLMLTENLSVTNGPAINKYPEYAEQIEAANQEHIAAVENWFLATINDGLDGVVGQATDDGDFWSVRSPVETAKDIQVPTFIIGGTRDIFQRGEPLLYEQLKNNVTTKLLVMHGAHIQAIQNAMVDHNTAASGGAPGSEALLLQWFDHYLKGMDTGAESLPNVTQYVEGYGESGTQRYASTTDWPHPKATPKRLYLRGTRRLSDDAPLVYESVHELYEPEAPVVTINTSENGLRMFGTVQINDGSACSNSAVQWTLGAYGMLPRPCYYNNARVEAAQDALIYQTAPLEEDMYINGPMQANIWMGATNSQAAIAIRIDDVDEFGRATPISSGLQSAAHRAVDESRSRYVDGVMVQPWHPFTADAMQPLRTSQPVLVQVEIFPAAALIRAGHRLRMAISSSNQIMGIWPLPQQAEADGNVTKIYNGPNHPSNLVVLVVPADELE